jgi:preprotein translocase subunit SecA
MTQAASSTELFDVFHARRVKAPELKGLDTVANAAIGVVKNRVPVLPRLKAAAARVEALEGKVKDLGATAFREAVEDAKTFGRLGKLEGDKLDYAIALVREAAVRTLGKRPFPVQLMGALGMFEGRIVEMATGEGKTLTAALAASMWAWSGRPVHVITVNDYLVARDAELNRPLYEMLGLRVGHCVHETSPWERVDMYRRNVVYVTSKELVADFLRDQIMLGQLRTSTQTVVSMLQGSSLNGQVMVPGLFRAIVDEADSLLIDEAVTPLIISNSPQEEANTSLYRAADELAHQMQKGRDFTIDTEVKQVDLTQRGKDRLAELSDHTGFWKGARRREELVTQALSAHHCFKLDEQYLITPDGKVQIIDESTGRVMADRSWRHGLHQAIEVKENVPVTADKENLARLSFQRFFRQYPLMAGMTGTVWEGRGEIWQIYNRPVVRIPTNRKCIRKQLPLRFFGTAEQKWNAVVKRICELNDKGIPVLVGTRSVWSSEEVSRRLTEAGRPHNVLNARHDAKEASIVSEAGQIGRITVATNMAGRGTDIHLGKGVKELGGLHVIATEPHGSARVDRQLFGRAARQGDPGCAQMFACAEDDVLVRHVPHLRKGWRAFGARRLINLAQWKAEKLARFNRKQVLRSDDWMDQSLPF